MALDHRGESPATEEQIQKTEELAKRLGFKSFYPPWEEIDQLRAELAQAQEEFRECLKTLDETCDELCRAKATIAQQVDKIREQKDEICELHRLRQQQGAVIAAMRLLLEDAQAFYCETRGSKHDGIAQVMIEGYDIAANHDAAIREPLESQIAELHELLHKLWQFVNLGDCPLTTRVIKALNKTAQVAAEH